MIRILKGLVALAVVVFSLNNPAAAAAYVVRAVRSVEQIVVSVAQDSSNPSPSSTPGAGQ